MRWSGKKVRELLEELSNGQTNFKTFPTGRPIKDNRGSSVYPNGYFRIEGAYGGYKLVYVLPYSYGAITNVTDGFVSSGKIADFLMIFGADGLKRRFREYQEKYKPVEKEMFYRKYRG